MGNDRIVFSSDVLNGAVGDMEKLMDVLENLITDLRNVDTSRINNQQVNIDQRLNALIRSFRSEYDNVQGIARAIRSTIELFEDAEKSVMELAGERSDPSEPSKKENPYGLTDQELEDERRSVIDNMLQSIETQNAGLNNLIDRKALSNLIGKLAEFYTIMAGDPSSLAQSDAHQMAIALLNTLSAKEDVSSLVLKYGEKVKDDVEFRLDTAIDILNLDDPGSGDEFKAFLDACPYIEGFEKVGSATEYFQHLLDAYNQYKKMTSMDPKMLSNICSGLRASGDSEMNKAAELLESFKDPYFCGVYCLASNGVSIAASKLSEAGRDALVNMYPSIVGKSIIKLSTRGTEALTNSAEIVDKARQIERLDDARQSAYSTIQNAASAYQSNPTDENYQKIIDAHAAYQALSAESVDAFADMMDAQNDSGLGKLFGNDSEKMRNIANIYRMNVNDGVLDMYASLE